MFSNKFLFSAILLTQIGLTVHAGSKENGGQTPVEPHTPPGSNLGGEIRTPLPSPSSSIDLNTSETPREPWDRGPWDRQPVPPPLDFIPANIEHGMRVFRYQEPPFPGEDLIALADELVVYWERGNNPEQRRFYLQNWNDHMRFEIRLVEDAPGAPDLVWLREVIDVLARHPERAPTLLQVALLERIHQEPDQLMRDYLMVQLFQELYVMTHVIQAFEDELIQQLQQLEQQAVTAIDFLAMAVRYDRMGWTMRANYMRAEAGRLAAWHRKPVLGLGLGSS